MELTYRQCTVEDVEDVLLIASMTFLETYGAMNKVSNTRLYIKETFTLEKTLKELENKHSTFYFFYLDDKLVGYIKVNEGKAQSSFKKENGLEGQRLYLYKKYHNKGIGKRMMSFIIALAKIRKKDFIWLGVWKKNTNAIGFYENMGFVKSGTETFLYGKEKQKDWLMKYPIKRRR